MSVKTGVSVEEYLHMTFDGPDREFVDGSVVERNMGNRTHSLIQARLVEIFYEIRKSHALWAMPELRHRVAPDRFRIPDVAVYRDQPPGEEVPTTPPFVAIEIASPDDRWSEIVAKLAEYDRWGVAHVLLVDPGNRRLFLYSNARLNEVDAFEIPEFGCRIQAGEIFAA